MGGPERRRSNATLPTTHAHATEDDDLRNAHLNGDGDDTDEPYDEDDSPLSAAPWGSPTIRGRSRNIVHRQDSHERSTSSGGLHHRHVARTGSGDQVDEYERGYAGQSNSNTYFHKYQAKKRRKRYPCGRWIRTCLLAGIPAYLVLIFLFLKRMNHQHALQRQQHGSVYGKLDYANSEDVSYFRELHVAAKVELKSRLRHDEQESGEASNTKERTRVLATLRRERTRPPSATDIDIPSTTILSPTEFERPDTLYQPDEAPRLALVKHSTLDEICGFQAQNAALETPGAFTFRDALTMPKSRITRVLITGILSQPAYLLALALKERCNVEVIIGFDAMYPNSLRNRLRLQEQMAVLTKNIPKLVRPFFLAHIGLDPLKHSKNFKVLEQTQEIDIIQTYNPTHIVHFASHDPALFRFTNPDWKNLQSPYVRTGDLPYDPALYGLRSGMLSMEQILASMAAAPSNDRPHFIYASASASASSSGSLHHSGDQTMHTWARRIDEVLADLYYQQHGVYSVGMRLPNSLYGPWGHPESDLYQLFDQTARDVSSTNVTNNAAVDAALASGMGNLDLLHVYDFVDGVIAAMQYRPENSKPALFEFSCDGTVSLQDVHYAAKEIADPDSTAISLSPRDILGSDLNSKREALQRSLGWSPRISLHEGLVRTIAWHLDRVHPYGPPLLSYDNATMPQFETGDKILKRHSFMTCPPGDLVCHGGRPFLPCASECARDKCIPTAFDELIPMVQELTEECDIVLYTHNFDKDATDLSLQSEFMEDGHPLVCNFAFINSDSELVDTVIDKVPDSELGKLGFELTPGDANRAGGINARKHEKLNGRLLYRGWILIWTKDTPEELSTYEKFLLKLSPGRLFHKDVKAAVFIDQAFGVSPRADDIQFLVHEMHRKPWNSRIVKRKTRPKAKFMLPAEPQRRAVVLMSELKYQDSSDAERLSPDEKITTYEATRFMRYSNGEEPLGKEPAAIKLQREYYDRLRASINPDHARGPGEPQHKFELKHWVRSRWVAHDMSHEESRQLRCEWYQEHVLWETDLDQLSFAYVMEKLELDRKLEYHEPDEVIQKQLSETTEMKKLLSDTFEWHALKTEQNKLYSPYEEMQVLPYDMDYTEERALTGPTPEDQPEGPDTPLFVRVISDRIMAYARKSWSNPKAAAEEYDTKPEL
jgi:nucleoside-diphosphate-sugar epimerase